MKCILKRRLLSTLLAGAMALGCLAGPVLAASSDSLAGEDGAADYAALSDGATVAGDPVTVQVGPQNLSRENDFNDGWKFYLGDSSAASGQNYDDSSWESVTLPHDFSISQSFTTSGEAESGFLPGGTGWYRKTFTLPASCADKQLVLNFDGAYADAYVYVNGQYLGENHYGYTSFAFDITDFVTCDGSTENVVAVKVVNNIPSSRWYSGSGIYRDVTLLVTDPVHVERYGTQVTTPDIASGVGTVQVAVTVKNDSAADADVTVRNTVYDADGKAVSSASETSVSLPAGASQTAAASVTVSNPKLWSLDSPTLYTVRTEVLKDGAVADSYDTVFGFRYFSFDSTGFHLNGENVKINGVCLHHDQGALGSAAYYDAMYRQLVVMKDMGVNAVRTSHNPHDRQFMEICNQIGMLVVEDCFDEWLACRNGNTYDISYYFDTNLTADNQLLGGRANYTWGEFAMRSMVLRDRNDPCLIMWSLANEVQEGTSGATSAFVDVADMLLGVMNELDGTRPATMSDNTKGSDSVLATIVSHVMDTSINPSGGVVGYNYASASQLDTQHNTYDVILSSETSSAVNSRSRYMGNSNAADVDGNYHLTSYDTSTVSWGLTAHDSLYNTLTRDFVAGEFVWTGWDYIGEPTPWNGTGSGSVSGSGAVPNSSYFGIVDTAGFEKDTYYLYRSQWNKNANTLHLVTAWDSDNMMTTSGKTPVVIYTNAPYVELYRNGTLIGTATRTENTSAAGHTYYTYTTESLDSSVCTAVSASGSASLYATFHVTYAAGTISAKAYSAKGGEEITDYSGKGSVSTPGTASQLKVTADKTEVLADGSSLVYVSVEVTDANGVLDTTASNEIVFSLSGDGEILGVDNGDQATTEKYQQSSVLFSTSSAQIAAYAGRALAILRSTTQDGAMLLNVSSDGLTGGSVAISTVAAGSGQTEGLTSYTFVRDYSVMAGTLPELLTTATGTLADGSTVEGTLSWDNIPYETYSTPGDYTVAGVLSFPGLESIQVTARLHVIGNVVAMRSIAAAALPGSAPTLPSKVKGVLADGTLCGEFSVAWNPDELSAVELASTGEVVTVNGEATVLGDETLPVTASIRIAEAVSTESVNVAPAASSLTQDIAADKQSDNLESIRNGVTKPGDNTSERWTNWNNRTTSATATLTFCWDTAQLLSGVNLYYYYDSCSAKPESVVFAYSLNGSDFTAIDSEEELVESYSLGAEYSYLFASPVNPVALRITFTQQNGTSGSNCVGVTECEIMTYAGKLESQTSAALSAILTDGEAAAVTEGVFTYTLSGTEVTGVEAENNVGVTILPAENGKTYILTVSEDGSDERLYTVTLDGAAACAHEHTELRNQKDATCTAEGYTGDTYCLDCGEKLASGEILPATGHTPVTQSQKDATCTTEGYTGDSVCAVCGQTLSTGTVIAKTEHSWNSGVVTTEPTETTEGVKTYTCTVCGATKTESIPATKVLTAPKVTLTVSQGDSGKIKLTGQFEDYANQSAYYEVTGHGFVYIAQSRLGTRTLTVNYPGRTRVNVTNYRTDGSYVYSMTPISGNVRYTIRAFLVYTDAQGRTMYAYSSPITTSYNALS